MLGYIEYHPEETAKAYLRKEQRLGATFLVLNMGRGARGMFSARRAARAADRMLAQGVRRAVFPTDFPHTAVFLHHGISPVDPLPLRRALSAVYVRRRLDALGASAAQAVIAITGESASDDLVRSVRELTLSYRYVLLSLRSGGEELAQTLRRQYGISLLLNPSSEQLNRADALVLFSPRPDLQLENRVLCTLYPGADERGRIPLRLDPAFADTLPPNSSPDQLAAALYGAGTLPPERFLGEITC